MIRLLAGAGFAHNPGMNKPLNKPHLKASKQKLLTCKHLSIDFEPKPQKPSKLKVA